MPHADSLILTLVGGFVLAFVFGMLANRLKLSPLVGHLAAALLSISLNLFVFALIDRMGARPQPPTKKAADVSADGPPKMLDVV